MKRSKRFFSFLFIALIWCLTSSLSLASQEETEESRFSPFLSAAKTLYECRQELEHTRTFQLSSAVD